MRKYTVMDDFQIHAVEVVETKRLFIYDCPVFEGKKCRVHKDEDEQVMNLYSTFEAARRALETELIDEIDDMTDVLQSRVYDLQVVRSMTAPE